MRNRPMVDITYNLPPPEHSFNWRRCFWIVLGIGTLPFLREAAALCAGNWRSVTGRTVRVETPLLDKVIGFTYGLFHDGWRFLFHKLNDIPWNPALIMAIGLIVALVLSIPLRRGSR